MPWGVLKEAIYDPGFEYMVQQGMLFIDDKDARIELGLEDGDTTEVICLNDSQLKRMATVMPLVDFKEQIKKIPYEQVQSLISYMIENECADISKTEILKKMTGIDIMSAIKLNRQAKED